MHVQPMAVLLLVAAVGSCSASASLLLFTLIGEVDAPLPIDAILAMMSSFVATPVASLASAAFPVVVLL